MQPIIEKAMQNGKDILKLFKKTRVKIKLSRVKNYEKTHRFEPRFSEEKPLAIVLVSVSWHLFWINFTCKGNAAEFLYENWTELHCTKLLERLEEMLINFHAERRVDISKWHELPLHVEDNTERRTEGLSCALTKSTTI